MLYRNFKIIFTAFSFFMFVSCDSMREREAIKNYTSPYMGTYVGELSGNVTGALIINIKKSGSVEVTKTFSGNSETFLQGIVFEGGALEKVSSSSTGFTLYGNLNSKGGTWKQGSWSGSWSVIKK
ncbi:hypothetical protein [Elizabethkingia anophelis]|uniref:hypothetical protein n=1 Tax=Elizabethkingia anophelis TaxID=1117645 RepID=UPI000412CB1E|nr:hypothetical protein [Elizabethkingia anophelis]MBE9394357.1 hypothetical protein [Elizabethkingia anophelis]MBE9407208.1 hypothetical protein [Elizabethkingia anophelis]MCT3745057.1 hypothetical protein [Elizabethkingia anophelis]MDC8026114.1 hypothetical protein [Elizabethkingia anophelis]MDV3492781.1 hypothetical protein [Elizabethkingia anophelis]